MEFVLEFRGAFGEIWLIYVGFKWVVIFGF